MRIYCTWDAYRKAMLMKQPKYYLKELLEDCIDHADSLKNKTKEKIIYDNLEELWEVFIEDLSNN